MENLSFTKYKEVKFERNLENNSLLITAPWISLEFETEPEHADKIARAIQVMDCEESVSSKSDNECVSWLLNFTQDFPVANILPRALTKSISSASNPEILVKLGTSSPENLLKLLSGDVQLSSEINSVWTWNLEEILKNAEIGENSYDPLALYTLIRRQRLLHEKVSKEDFNLFDQLKTLLNEDEENFFRVAAIAIRQTHHVTKQCVPSLEPALTTFIEAAQNVKEFMQEEKGHDKLVFRSLNQLGFQDPLNLPVFDETKLLMRTLHFAAEHCPAAFASLIGIFEAGGHMENDSMAELLKLSSKPKSAEGLQKHFEINRDHNHACVGQDMAASLGAVSKVHATVAIRLAEVAVALGNQILFRVQNEIIKKVKAI